jgi:hypothetical protein
MAGYTRTDTTNNIADGNIINATDLDNEFDGIQAAFNSSTGHNHDGTTGEGAPILVLGPTQDVVVGASTVTPKTTNTVDIGSSSLKFKDLFLAGNASIGGTLAVTGVATLTAQPILSSLTASRAVFTDGSKGLVSNAITGTGNVVMSASPTLTGTISAEALTTSGAVTLSGGTANGVAYLNGSKVLTTGSALTFDGGGNLTLGGTTPRLLSNMSGALSTRFIVQNSTTNGNTRVYLYPNGTGTISAINGVNNSDVAATDYQAFDLAVIGTTDVRLSSSATGAATPLPLTFYTNGSEQMRLTGTGLGIGTSSPAQKLSVAGNGNFIGTGVTSLTSPTVYFSNTTASTGRTYALNSTDGGLFQIFDASAGNATRVTLDSSGNLGLGVTPSAWNAAIKALEMPDSGFLAFANTNGNISTNAFFDTGYKYKATAAAARYSQSSGQHLWFTAPSGTAGNAISFTQAMTLDASGNLGVGETSPTSRLHVAFTSNSVDATLRVQQKGNNTAAGITLSANDNNGAGYNFIQSETTGGTSHWRISGGVATSTMAFSTGGSERARIDSSGNLLIGTTSPVQSGRLSVADTVNGVCIGLQASGAGNTTGTFLNCIDSSDIRFRVFTNGDVQNTNNSYGAISDAKLKENVTDATPKLDKLNQVRIVNYNLKNQPEQKLIGVIAQELEQIFPGMVEEAADRDQEGNDLGTTTKSVKYSVFVPMLIKAMQEQQALIESLKARLDAANL